MELINKIRKSRKGFTLVEIIVVLVILAVLAAFTIPTMLGFVTDAKNKASIAVAREVYLAAQAAAVEVVNATPTTTGNDLGTALSGKKGTVTNATMKTMLNTDDLATDDSWTVVAAGGTGAATGKISSVALTIAKDKKVITITAGQSAVITDAPVATP